ncbi:T9SS type A sorting domain-containing protein [bacterium]|nr:T9SS type A sorting domain-containing protein [bacterium]
MVQKLIILMLGLSVGFTAYAKGGDDDKNDKKEEKKTTIKPDSLVLVDLDVTDQTDDTLVFEDWEDTKGGGNGGATDGVLKDDASGSGDSDAGVPGSVNPNNIVEKLKDARDNRYEVNFEVYPNPVANLLHIKVDVAPDQVLVYSLTGQLMHQSRNATVVDVSAYESGTYLIQLIFDDHVETRKFVKRN